VVKPHDAPTAGQLLEAVREWLEGDVIGATEGRLQFHARVAANVLAIVERELALGADQASEHATRLAQLGCADDAALAAAIRGGDMDDRLDEVRALVRASVVDKLRVANPKHLVGADRPTTSE
jgi:DNA-binding SARP family transcriptional activator